VNNYRLFGFSWLGVDMRQSLAVVTLCIAGLVCSSHALAKQGTWDTTLQARDLNGDGVADAYYDTLQNITWLDNFDDGTMSDRAQELLTSPLGPRLEKSYFWGINDWIAPTGVSANSQLQVLWRQTLGNTDTLASTGPFKNITKIWDAVWTADLMRVTTIATPFTDPVGLPDPNGKEQVSGIFSFRDAQLAPFYYGRAYGITPIHAGDIGVPMGSVAEVPEPGVWLSTLLGLGALMLTRRRTR
jgi:hypothetical protein